MWAANRGGFMIAFENGFKLWHMGDTGVFVDMRWIGERVKPELVPMPIGGGQFVRNPSNAAKAARDLIKASTVIPLHCLINPACRAHRRSAAPRWAAHR